MRRFDVLRVATGSYTVESKRIASRKLFKRVPGLQDAKNRPKRTKIIENRKTTIFVGFLDAYSHFIGVDAGIICRGQREAAAPSLCALELAP